MQAQTVANFYLAFEQNLAIIPVLNKCDMNNAQPDQVAEQIQQVPDLSLACLCLLRAPSHLLKVFYLAVLQFGS